MAEEAGCERSVGCVQKVEGLDEPAGSTKWDFEQSVCVEKAAFVVVAIAYEREDEAAVYLENL